VDDAFQVRHPDVLALRAELDQQVEAGQRRRARARHHDLDVADLLAGQVEAIEDRRRDDDRRAVLVVMEDRDVHPGLELLLDLEAFRALDVLEIDAAEGRLQRRDDLDELLDVLLLDLDVEAVDHRLGGERPDVAQPQHGRAVGDDGDEVLPRGQLRGLGGIVDDRLAGGGDAGRIGQREVALVAERLGRLDLDLTGARQAVIDERAGAEIGGQVALHRGGSGGAGSMSGAAEVARMGRGRQAR